MKKRAISRPLLVQTPFSIKFFQAAPLPLRHLLAWRLVGVTLAFSQALRKPLDVSAYCLFVGRTIVFSPPFKLTLCCLLVIEMLKFLVSYHDLSKRSWYNSRHNRDRGKILPRHSQPMTLRMPCRACDYNLMRTMSPPLRLLGSVNRAAFSAARLFCSSVLRWRANIS